MRVPVAGPGSAGQAGASGTGSAPANSAPATATSGTAVVSVEDAVAKMYCDGHPISDICRAFGLPRVAITAMLNRPDVKFALHGRLSGLQFRAVEFKLRAFEGAENGLEDMHAALADPKLDINLKRNIMNDLARLAHLEPRKQVEVRDFQDKGISEDVKDFFKQVMAESRGVVTLDTEQP